MPWIPAPRDERGLIIYSFVFGSMAFALGIWMLLTSLDDLVFLAVIGGVFTLMGLVMLIVGVHTVRSARRLHARTRP